jgi:hypothetical protein
LIINVRKVALGLDVLTGSKGFSGMDAALTVEISAREHSRTTKRKRRAGAHLQIIESGIRRFRIMQISFQQRITSM